MAKLYKYTFGDWEKYGPAEDDADAYERRVSVDPQFHYVPVVIEEVTIEGYKITVSEILPQFEIPIEQMEKEQLKSYLRANNLEFHHAMGEDKLRELALQHI